MKYLKNQSMEFLDIDDDNVVVYDPDSGDTHYISETGKTILALLDENDEADPLISELCKMYAADKEELTSDVLTFLGELVEKKVLITL